MPGIQRFVGWRSPALSRSVHDGVSPLRLDEFGRNVAWSK